MTGEESSPTEPIPQPRGGGLQASDLVLPLIAYKSFIYVVVLLSRVLLPPLFNTANYHNNFHWPADAPPSLETMFSSWDAQMHLQLSHEGYDTNVLSVNHQPLWPLLINLFSHLTFGDHLVAGLILSNLFSIIGLCLVYELAREDCGERSASIALVLMLAFPGALFFSFAYTESLFLLLSVLFLSSLKKSHYGVAAITAFLMPLTRIVGILCVFPFAWRMLSTRESPTKWFYCVSPVLGLLTYFLVMDVSTGNPLAGIEGAQRYASVASFSKIFDVGTFLRALSSSALFLSNGTNLIYDRLWFVWFLLVLGFTWKIDSVYFVYALFMGLVPAVTSSFMSYTRYIAVVFPIFFATAQMFANTRREYWLWLTVAALFAIQILFLIRHVNFFWVA